MTSTLHVNLPYISEMAIRQSKHQGTYRIYITQYIHQVTNTNRHSFSSSPPPFTTRTSPSDALLPSYISLHCPCPMYLHQGHKSSFVLLHPLPQQLKENSMLGVFNDPLHVGENTAANVFQVFCNFWNDFIITSIIENDHSTLAVWHTRKGRGCYD